MAFSKPDLAAQILEKEKDIDLETFLSESYFLTGDDFLISLKTTVQEKYQKARQDLIELIKSQTPIDSVNTIEISTTLNKSVSPDFIIEIIQADTNSKQDKIRVSENTVNFIADVKSAGLFSLDIEAMQELINKYNLPNSMSAKEISTALNLYIKGVDSVSLIQRISETELPTTVKDQMFNAAFLINAFEDANPKLTAEIKLINNPIDLKVTLQEERPQRINVTDNQIYFKNIGDNKVIPHIPINFDSTNKSATRLSSYTFNTLKGGTNEIARSLFFKASRKGAESTIRAGLEAIGISTKTALSATGFGAMVAVGLEALKMLGSVTTKILGTIIGQDNAIKIKKAIRNAFLALSLSALSNLIIGIPLAIVGATVVAAATVVSIAVFVFVQITTILFSVGIFILCLTTFAYVIIQMGAYMVPPGGFGVQTEMGRRGQNTPGELDPGFPPPNFPEEGSLPGETLYLNVIKYPSQKKFENNSGNDQTVKYTVGVVATISDVTVKEIFCTNNIITKDGKIELPSNRIDPGDAQVAPGTPPRNFTYDGSIDANTYNDAAYADRCCVLAVVDGTNRGACGVASVEVGDSPLDCPEGLPINGDDQYSPWVSNHFYSAADINLGTGGNDGDYNTYDCGLPVYSTHAGYFTFDDTGNNEGYGIYVDVEGICDEGFKSRYAHLRSVNPDLTSGQFIAKGTFLGLLDDTGTSSACHLHYEIRLKSSDGSYDTRVCQSRRGGPRSTAWYCQF